MDIIQQTADIISSLAKQMEDEDSQEMTVQARADVIKWCRELIPAPPKSVERFPDLVAAKEGDLIHHMRTNKMYKVVGGFWVEQRPELTGADIAANSITASKIVAGSINAAKVYTLMGQQLNLTSDWEHNEQEVQNAYERAMKGI